MRGLIATFQETYKSFGSYFSEKFLAAPDAFKDLSRKAEEAAASFNMQAVGLAPDKIQGFFDSLKSEAKKLQLEIPVIAKIAQVVGMDLASSSLDQVLRGGPEAGRPGAAAEKTRELLLAGRRGRSPPEILGGPAADRHRHDQRVPLRGTRPARQAEDD